MADFARCVSKVANATGDMAGIRIRGAARLADDSGSGIPGNRALSAFAARAPPHDGPAGESIEVEAVSAAVAGAAVPPGTLCGRVDDVAAARDRNGGFLDS